MKKFALLLVALVALAGADASAKPKKPPKPKGKPPTVYAVEAAPLAWRQAPRPVDLGVFVICWDQMPTCPLSHATIRVTDPDSKKVDIALRVINSDGKIVNQVRYGTWAGGGWADADGSRINFWWMPGWETPPGLYRYHFQARDKQKNVSSWVTSSAILFV